MCKVGETLNAINDKYISSAQVNLMDVSCTLDLGLITDLWAQTDRQTDGQTDEPRGNSAMTRC